MLTFKKYNAAAVNVPAINEWTLFVDANDMASYKLDNGDVKTFGSIFGQNYKKAIFKNLASPTQITSNVAAPFLTLTTDNLPAGEYRIGWSITSRYSVNTRDPIFTLVVQSNEEDRSRAEGKDAGADQHVKAYDCDYFTLSGTNEIRIDAASTTAGDVTTIYKAVLEIWRVA